MSYEFSEDGLVEAATQEVLEDLDWEVITAWRRETFSQADDRSDGLLGRANKTEVVLRRDLRAALCRLNPGLPGSAYDDAIAQIVDAAADQPLVSINRAKHRLLTRGVQVSFQDADGVLQKPTLRVFDFNQPSSNRFLAVRQLEVVGALYNRRPDVVGFVNGIPLVFFELKAHHTDLQHAFDDNLADYKTTIPELLYPNAFVILSNGTDARVGTVTSPYQFFLEWKRIEEDDEGVVSLDTLLRGVCEPSRLLDLFENFLLFDDSGGDVAKIMARNHQFIGVNRVIDKARSIDELQSRLGVFWHTQGSGKSYSMVFLCQKILRKFGGSYTFLLVVDRSELESQLYDTFSGCGAIPEKLPGRGVRAKSRDHLRELLSENHRYVFTLIHKFSVDPNKEREYPLITERSNIIVISDEAHRTQGGVFARNMRFHAIPNASYLGFTGTPLIAEEVERTKEIFGGYVSVCDFKRAIADEATLPLRYQNRGEKLEIDRPDLDERMAEIIENEDLDEDQVAKLKRDFARDYPILTSGERLDEIARDLVWHFNDRGYQGKAMFVALDKPTAVRMYDKIMHFWPQYERELAARISMADDAQAAQKLKRHLVRVQETEVCVVVSSEQNEVARFAKSGLDIAPHRKKMHERNLEKEFKNEDNPFRLAIVCAMWITGFDAPCVSTVYLDKPIKGHTLMQTIARANRVYDDEKENGLIIDYGNVYQQLRQAYSVYGEGSKVAGGKAEQPDMPDWMLEGLVDELAEAIGIVRAFLAEVGFELDDLIHTKSAIARLAQLKEATNAVCLNEKTRAQFEVAARNVFRKYKALYPDPLAKPSTPANNAIEAVYGQLNQKIKAADISDVMRRLQDEVSMSVRTRADGVAENDYVDLGTLDFDKLRAAFARSKSQNAFVFDLQEAIEQKLERMCRENPVRLQFYERYKDIIREYNEGKDSQAVQKTFDEFSDFLENYLTPELDRAFREDLSNEELAIYDVLKKPTLSRKETADIKQLARKLLVDLKAEKLRIERWRESPQVCAGIKTAIINDLQWLPQPAYPDDELADKSLLVYQHVYTSYPGGGRSVYGNF